MDDRGAALVFAELGKMPLELSGKIGRIEISNGTLAGTIHSLERNFKEFQEEILDEMNDNKACKDTLLEGAGDVAKK